MNTELERWIEDVVGRISDTHELSEHGRETIRSYLSYTMTTGALSGFNQHPEWWPEVELALTELLGEFKKIGLDVDVGSLRVLFDAPR